MQQVEDNVWISDYCAATDAIELDAVGITHVFAFIPDVPTTAVLDRYASLGISCMQWCIEDDDSVNIRDILRTTNRRINRIRSKHHNAKILLHCIAGRSRSAACVVYYISRRRRISISEAYYRLAVMRSLEINSGFLAQLHDLDRSY